MKADILTLETAKKIAKLERENERLKEEIRNLRDQLYKLTTKFN